jgi:hypothetical protein
MTKPGYTHIIVPKDLHTILKAEAEASGMSIANYIAERLARLQSIESLVTGVCSINTTSKVQKPRTSVKKDKRDGLDAIRTHDLRLVKAVS